MVALAPTQDQVWSALKRVPDPEIPVVSVVDLGIVRDVHLSDDDPRVVITPTYSGCPATRVIEDSIRRVLDAEGWTDVRIETAIAPPWTTDWVTQEGQRKLLEYGIAPPSRTQPVACPNCSSLAVEKISQFGSTPCKALYRCTACLEPFDRFKCY